MRITLTESPQVRQQVTAWNVWTDDGLATLIEPVHSRYHSYFTAAMAREVAKHTRGFPDPATSRTIKEVVCALPAGWETGART